MSGIADGQRFVRTLGEVLDGGLPDDPLEARLWLSDLASKWQELDPRMQAVILDNLSEEIADLLPVALVADEVMDTHHGEEDD